MKQFVIIAMAFMLVPWIVGAGFWLGIAVFGWGPLAFITGVSIGLPGLILTIAKAVILAERYE